MDIVAESLSAKILKSKEVLVNGQDIMDYIRSKLSTAVEFNGVYDDINNIPLSAQFNGSIVIVDSKEYIYSDKSEPNHWQEIGDETAIGQLVEYLDALSVKVDNLSNDLVGEASDLSSASTINAAKNYAKDLVDSLDVVDVPVQNQFVVAVSQKDGAISVERALLTIPEGLSSYADTVANLSNDGYMLSTELSTKNKVEISQTFEGQFVQTDLSIVKVVDEDLSAYAEALHDDALDPNALYVLQLSNLNAFGQTIRNVADGQTSSDAATYGQLVSANNAVSSVLSSLSTYTEVKQQLSNDGYATQSNIPTYSDISVNIHLSDYALANNVSSTTELDAKFNTLSTYSQTKQQLSSDGYALTSTTTQVANELSNAISSKVYVGNLQTGEHADLSVLKVTANEYEQLVADANSSSVDLSNNVIYIVSSDNMNMYGEKILNLTMEEDDEPSEATNKHYVDSHLSGLSSKIDVLSTYEQTKSQLMTDGFAQTSSIPSYNDISTNIHLSEYALANNVSSTTELNAKFNTLSTYSQTKQQLSSDGYATQSSIPSYSDISANIHLSNYALSDDVSSKIDLEAAFNEKLDAIAGAKSFSELSTYSLYEHVSYNGLIWECISAITTAGPWNENNWRITDMTSPDATLDVTNDDRLRVVSADGSIIWQQGYNMTQEQYSAITANIDALSGLVTAANNNLETILNESL